MVPNPSSLVGIGTVGSMLAGGNISKVQLPDGITYAIKDSVTPSLTQSEIDAGTDTSNKFISAKVLSEVIAAAGANDGALKLQKDSDSATSIFTANQSTDTTLTYTTSTVGSASN